jgi:uncharacterized protein YecE (DUF72 family)
VLLHVGQSELRGDIGRYAQRFDLLELRAEAGKVPKLARLRQWRAQVPEAFMFSVVLPRRVSSLETADVAAELEQALGVADAVRAPWIVVQTPASVTPSTRSRQRLQALLEHLPREARRVAWEPRGIWQDEEAERAAEQLGVILVRDVSRSPAPAGQVAYVRMRGLGDASRVRASAIERVAERLADREEACVVIEGEGAVRAAALLRQLALAASVENEADDDGEPFDDEAEEGEEPDLDGEDDDDAEADDFGGADDEDDGEDR